MTNVTMTCQELQSDLDRARRETQTGPVFITDEGVVTQVLLSISAYLELGGRRHTIMEALSMLNVPDIYRSAPPSSSSS